MKPSQVLLVFICVFVFLTIGLLTATISPGRLLAQPPVTPTIGDPPSIGNEPSPRLPQNSSASPVYTTADNMIYLPAIYKPACSLNAEEASLESLIMNDSGQQRSNMGCHITLAQVARERAQDMGQRDYCDHENPDGNGPNFLVSQAGYTLPAGWTSPRNLNYIESISCGYPTAELAFEAWMRSSGHKIHVLGEDPFWAEQTNYGVGYAFVESGTYQHYFVFISAPPQP